MRHLKKFNESVETNFEDFMDNFSYISDTLGDPSISKSKWGNLFKYVLKWNLGLNIYELQKPSDFVDKLKSIIENFDDIISAQERVSDFNIRMSIDKSILIVEASPVDLGTDDYQFIVGQMWREIKLDINEIERFLNKNDINIKTKKVIDEYETTGTAWVDIKTDPISSDIRQDLINRFNSEMSKKSVDRIDYSNREEFKPEIDRDIEISVGQNFIKFNPVEEKTFITF